MTGILSPGAACVIPETLKGLPVTELGDRAFAGSRVREVFLPESLRRIGRYCFYGCEELECLHVYASTMEIGGGVFNGCGAVREIFIHMGQGERSALRDFVTELNGRVTVHYLLTDESGQEREAARLIFPIYYDEAVENTPARITVSNIHGTGQKYRYCFDDKKVRFDRYDKLFVYEKAEEPVAAAAEIAVLRLMYPHGLWEEAGRDYRRFIEENLFEVLFENLGHADVFKWLIAEFATVTAGSGAEAGAVAGNRLEARALTEDRLEARGEALTGAGAGNGRAAGLSEAELDRLALEASKRRLAELSGILMDLKHRSFPPKRRKFEF